MKDLDAGHIAHELSRLGATLGQPLSIVEVTGSTSDDARLAATQGAPHGATFIADAQTKGRGRGGHTWHSPAGENLYLSVVLRSQLDPKSLTSIPLVMGIAVAEVIDARLEGSPGGGSVRAALKWPNDVLVEHRKVAGVLVEGQLRGQEMMSLVVGIGINVRAASFPEPIAARATSLRLLGCADLDRGTLAAALLDRMGRAVRDFERGRLQPFLEAIRGRDELAGTEVEAAGIRGTAAGIDAEGQLVIRDGVGQEHRILSGTVNRIGDLG